MITIVDPKSKKETSSKPATLKAFKEGTLNIDENISLPCCVLEDGRRVFTLKAFLNAVGMSGKIGTHGLADFFTSDRLKPFVSADFAEPMVSPIHYIPITGGRAYGFPAHLLVEALSAISEAGERGYLHTQQAHIAAQANNMLRAIAKTGIIALVDEATGYTAYKKPTEYRDFNLLFLTEEIKIWAKKVPDSIPIRIAELRNWNWNSKYSNGNRNMGNMYREYLYNFLPLEVQDEIRERCRDEKGKRVHRWHQHLSERAEKALDHQIRIVDTILQCSYSWTQFQRNFNNYFCRRDSRQLELMLEPEAETTEKKDTDPAA